MNRCSGLSAICVALVLLGLCAGAGATDYYVNDVHTNGDVWCSVAGDAGNNGLSVTSPVDTVQAVIDGYVLTGGDTIYVDSGTYPLSAEIAITSADEGTATNAMVTIVGNTNLTVFDRNSRSGSARAFRVNNAAFIRIENLRCTDAGQGIRVEHGENVAIGNCEVDYCNYGIVLSEGTEHTVAGCELHHVSLRGVMGSSSDGPLVENCEFHHITGSGNPAVELFACPSAVLTGNTLRDNAGDGIYLSSCSSAVVSDNTIYNHNGDPALCMYGCDSADVSENVLRNSKTGVQAANCPDLELAENRIYSNHGKGADVSAGTCTIVNNLIYDNDDQGLYADNIGGSEIRNNTFYLNGAANLELAGNYEYADVRNNISYSSGEAQRCIAVADIETTWYSDYNTFYATNHAYTWYWRGTRYLLASWQHYTDRDRHSMDVDPMFVDPDGADDILGGANGDDDDFHLQSTVGHYLDGIWWVSGDVSLCVDAGDPDTDVSAEPAPNGGRANMGRYGATDEASKSPEVRSLEVLYPDGGEIGFRRYRVRWATVGPWVSNDTVKIQYSANNGGDWTDCENANPLDFDNSLYGWDINELTPGTQYLVRVVYTSDPGVASTSAAPFEIRDPSPKTAYVNDDATADDTWCSAVGSMSNTGLSPASPQESLQLLLETYQELGPEDEIRLDTGSHDNGRMIFFTDSNSGKMSSNLVVRGSTNGDTVLGESSDYDVFYLRRIDHLRIENLVIIDGDYGILAEGTDVDPCDGIEIVNCTMYDLDRYGIHVSGVTNVSIVSNECYNLDLGAIHAEGHGTIGANVARDCRLSGIQVSGAFLVEGNTTRNNDGAGIMGADGAVNVVGNTVCSNGYGVSLNGSPCLAVGNTIFDNDGTGLYLHESANAHRNVIRGSGYHGVYMCGSGTLRNNLIRDSADFNVYYRYDGGSIVNNTIVGGDGLWIGSDPNGVSNVNNIYRCSGSGRTAVYVSDPPFTPEELTSDYNNFHVTDGAVVGYWYGPRTTLDAWQAVTIHDENSLDIDPLFVDPAAGEFHLQSIAGHYTGLPFTAPAGGGFANDALLSFCVDAGDPTYAYGQESADNGGRINLGAFGNTADASHSPGERVTMVTDPGGAATVFGICTVTWLTRGPWSADNVRIEYSSDGGTNWVTITNGIDYALGSYDWDTSAVAPGPGYLLRVGRDDGVAMDTNDAPFEILASGPRTYYVNDSNTANDVYSTAVGDDANDGLSPSTPKATIQAVLDTYNIEGGDTVRIDTGYYPLSATIVITTNDVGTSGKPIVFLGSTHADGSIIDRTYSWDNVFHMETDIDNIRFDGLHITGGKNGVYAYGGWNNPCIGIEVVNCNVYSNGSIGVYLYTCTNALVADNTVWDNSHYGVYLYDADGDVVDNVCYGNGSDGIVLNSGDGLAARNSSYDNRGAGLEVYHGRRTIEDNRCYRNWGDGLALVGADSEAVGNWSYQNKDVGIRVNDLFLVHRNVIHANGGSGMHVAPYSDSTVRNNLIYNNTTNRTWDFNVNVQSTRANFRNNTLYGGNGLEISDVYDFTNMNNIIWATGAGSIALKLNKLPDEHDVFASDYNNLYATDGAFVGYWSGIHATLEEWQFASGRDGQSVSVDPLFVDADGADDILGGANWLDDRFHLQSTAGSHTGLPFTASSQASFVTNSATSACVDAGRPSSGYAQELAPDGGRINMGAFGNTADASLSPEATVIDVFSPQTDDVLRGMRRVKWITRGPWEAGDLVRLAWSRDGTNYTFLGDVPFEDGFFDWDTSGMLPFPHYSLRARKVDDLTVTDTVADFEIIYVIPDIFYVNDTNITDDAYCTAPGNISNTGISAFSPKASIKQILMDFTLIPGDQVRVDTGFYPTHSTIELVDSGSAAQSIRLVGVTNGFASLLDATGLEEPVLRFPFSDYWDIEYLQIANGGDVGIMIKGELYGDLCDSITIASCRLYGNDRAGVFVDNGTNVVVRDNVCCSNSVGIQFYDHRTRNHGEARANICFDNRNQGIRVDGAVNVIGNDCYSNNGGLYSDGTDVFATGNRFHHNQQSGATMNRGTLSRNHAYANGTAGIVLYSGTTGERNVSWNNGGNGIQALGGGSSGALIRNNLVYSNNSANVYVQESATVENNTLYGGNGIHIYDPDTLALHNNIVWCRGIGNTAVHLQKNPATANLLLCDFNNLYVTDGAYVGFWMGLRHDLDDWKYATRQALQSVSKDPLFVDIDGPDNILGGTNAWDDNFHLASTAGSYTGAHFTAESTGAFAVNTNTSPCVDAGRPSSDYANELSPDGMRINMGAFGNTEDASLSPEERSVELTSITGGDVLRATRRVTWTTVGPWGAGDLVELWWNGTNKTWEPIASVAYERGYYDWDTTVWAPDHGQMRADRDGGGAHSHLTPALDLFVPTGLVFYVNDNSLSNDVYCSAVGDDANNGLSTNEPMATVKKLLQKYNSLPGDQVKIDTGTWVMDSTRLFYHRAGSPTGLVRFVGSTHADGTLFNRNDKYWDGFRVTDCDYLSFESLEIAGADDGFSVWGSNKLFSSGIEFHGCDIYNNEDYGIAMGYVSNIVVSHCKLHHNGSDGLRVFNSDNSGYVGFNECYNNDNGVDLNGTFTAEYNDCHHNSAYGLYMIGTILASSNTAHENNGGLYVGGEASEAVGNEVYLNSGSGLYLYYSAAGRRNKVYSNYRNGIYARNGGEPTRMLNNLVYDNAKGGSSYYNMYVNVGKALVENNTLYGANGLRFYSTIHGVTNRNNTIWASGSGATAIRASSVSGTFVSDYNNLYATDTAKVGYWSGYRDTLADWQAASSVDVGSIGANPLFVDPDGTDDLLGDYNGDDDDFHPRSTAGSWHGGLWLLDDTNSPSIDAGNPMAPFGLEPDYNGLRINQGAYGNTVEASKTAYTGRLHTLTFTINPTNGGSVTVWPDGTLYPPDREVFASATPADHFHWADWSGDIADTNASISFYVLTNMNLTAGFNATFSTAHGVPDWWMHYYGLPLTPDATELDSDGDGLLNWEEYIAGTHPMVGGSAFEFTGFDPADSGGANVLRWPSAEGRVYGISWGSDLMTPFTRITSNIVATPPENVYTDSVHNAESAGFYNIDVRLP